MPKPLLVAIAAAIAVIACSKQEPTPPTNANSATEASKPTSAQAKANHPPAANPAPAAPKKAPTHVAAAAPAKAVCVDCGTVTGVSEVVVKGEAGATGAVVGGVAGAVVGSQLGSGNARTVAGIAGAAGGALAGREVEKRMKTHKKYDVGVKMEDGSLRTVSYDTPPTWHTGDKVRIVNGKLEAIH